MKKRSKQNNPEQKTNNGVNNMEAEMAQDDQVVKALKRNAKRGQPDYSK
ncbi:hypothetical protein SAMN05877753_10594 [Bacillus oleivorans]|uniref:Glycogen biosynthesis protein GlgD n=1 Tax=Bacillus oleivorans TaxID=1448271 RepID=A0A285CW53_9BACI|nr:glycogen biosynthesis protein GlgD [Bacillus oleivorans]SNX71288.1 hypothetical protein SAMN05877753_10594 [Bacillus oleivorans]